jgi:hypothetical protein
MERKIMSVFLVIDRYTNEVIGQYKHLSFANAVIDELEDKSLNVRKEESNVKDKNL